MKYTDLYEKFSTNTFNLEISKESADWTLFKCSTPGADSSIFRKELAKAVRLCARTGMVDILTTGNGLHHKTRAFLDAFIDENDDGYYEPLREVYDDETDILLSLSDKDFLSVKSLETNLNKISRLGPMTDLYYEYRVVREGISLYIKLVFSRKYLEVDIHSERENFID